MNFIIILSITAKYPAYNLIESADLGRINILIILGLIMPSQDKFLHMILFFPNLIVNMVNYIDFQI